MSAVTRPMWNPSDGLQKKRPESLLKKTTKTTNWNSKIVYTPAEYVFPEIFNPDIYKNYLNFSIYATNMDKTDNIFYRPKNSGDLISKTNTEDACEALTPECIIMKIYGWGRICGGIRVGHVGRYGGVVRWGGTVGWYASWNVSYFSFFLFQPIL